MSEAIQEMTLNARAPLKKILAARGKLKGNFYFAGDTRGKSAGIVVTLAARDPKGSRVMTQGKALRKHIPGAKFGRGLVLSKGGKLIFELHAGTASRDHIKLAFRKSLGKMDGLTFLRKAALTTPDDTPDPEEGEAIDVDELFGALSVKERAEVLDLIGEQQQLASLDRELRQAFLSTKDAEAEAREQINEQMAQIQQLEQTLPLEAVKLAQARRALAEMIYVGPEPFPGPGEPLSADIHQALKASTEVVGLRLSDRLERISASVKTMRREVSGRDDAWRQQQSVRLLAELANHQGAADSYVQQLQRYLPE